MLVWGRAVREQSTNPCLGSLHFSWGNRQCINKRIQRMSSIYAGKKLSKVRGEKVIGDKRSNNIREDLIIRFHVTQGREKAKFF